MSLSTWRDYLTDEERTTILRADDAKAEWQRLNAARAGIVNRAVKRSTYKSRADGPLEGHALAEQPNGLTP